MPHVSFKITVAVWLTTEGKAVLQFSILIQAF